jgi:tRNA threonylcarbamoyladenosine biosynthesis protein TsaE
MKMTFNLSEIENVAMHVLKELPYKTVLLYGEMGAGKTTLIKEIAKQIGVQEVITSPTFSLVNEYEAGETLVYHFDFYRIENEQEALDMGIEDYLYAGNYSFIEWPERIKNLLPKESSIISIRKNNDQSRTLTLLPVK